jgi:hypothetical protein
MAEQLWTLVKDWVDEEELEQVASEVIEIFESFEFDVSGAKTLCEDANIEPEDEDLDPVDSDDNDSEKDDED